MVMAPAGWAIERAMAAVPLSRIAEQRAIAPERLADNADSRQAPASELGLTRIFRPPLTRAAPGIREAHCCHLRAQWLGCADRLDPRHAPLAFAVGPNPRAAYMCAHAKRQAQLRLLQLLQSRVQHKPVAYRSDGNA